MLQQLLSVSIRPFIVGRKSYLFCDTVRDANASVKLYSLIECAKARNIEPYQYLRRVFAKLPKVRTVKTSRRCCPIASNIRILMTPRALSIERLRYCKAVAVA